MTLSIEHLMQVNNAMFIMRVKFQSCKQWHKAQWGQKHIGIVQWASISNTHGVWQQP